ncbi:hypothetical protein PY254_07240 [Rhodanobacter sp. AS-Z3]|uniref:hypothetical protein n=1 Tax=Rhodanobacter sp. AS-Z3 TaxID=3031330 RepID=UPI00247948D2|nr:hypothetical protein [Rhodanobacter sp. AS-Z3]WEN16449.1 hypothetical protein PY254_07240 [Rhodanobacter sp. AS-Z3]
MAGGTTHAQSQNPEAPFSCDGNATPETAIAVATVQGEGPLFFIRKGIGCPSDQSACREKAYLVPGDTVLTTKPVGEYVCAFFPDSHDGHAGWLRKDRLLPRSDTPSLSDWEGRWTLDDNVITLSRRGSSLHADGEAYYPMADPPLEQFPGGPNLGSMGGTARPQGRQVRFVEEDCRVTAILAGKFLVVSDNQQCGGMNVRFNGTYQRQ